MRRTYLCGPLARLLKICAIGPVHGPRIAQFLNSPTSKSVRMGFPRKRVAGIPGDQRRPEGALPNDVGIVVRFRHRMKRISRLPFGIHLALPIFFGIKKDLPVHYHAAHLGPDGGNVFGNLPNRFEASKLRSEKRDVVGKRMDFQDMARWIEELRPTGFKRPSTRVFISGDELAFGPVYGSLTIMPARKPHMYRTFRRRAEKAAVLCLSFQEMTHEQREAFCAYYHANGNGFL